MRKEAVLLKKKKNSGDCSKKFKHFSTKDINGTAYEYLANKKHTASDEHSRPQQV